MKSLLDHPSDFTTNTSNHNVLKRPLLQDILTTMAFFEEIIHPRDPKSGLFDEAKRKEIEELISHGTFQIVVRSDDELSLNRIPSRNFLSIERIEDGSELYKARFVFGGRKDDEKRDIFHNFSTIEHLSMRLLIALGIALNFI